MERSFISEFSASNHHSLLSSVAYHDDVGITTSWLSESNTLPFADLNLEGSKMKTHHTSTPNPFLTPLVQWISNL